MSKARYVTPTEVAYIAWPEHFTKGKKYLVVGDSIAFAYTNRGVSISIRSDYWNEVILKNRVGGVILEHPIKTIKERNKC